VLKVVCLHNVFKCDDLSRSTLALVLVDVQGGVTLVVSDLTSNTEHRRSRDVPPAWNNLIFSDGLPGVGIVSESLSVVQTEIFIRNRKLKRYTISYRKKAIQFSVMCKFCHFACEINYRKRNAIKPSKLLKQRRN